MDNKLAFLTSKGIDVNAGLSYLGDQTMYDEILLEFKNGFINQITEIKNTFIAGDCSNYVILVHALKSNCKTLGITSLAQMAYDHEMKGKENDWDYIKNNINSLIGKANEIYQILIEYFAM